MLSLRGAIRFYNIIIPLGIWEGGKYVEESNRKNEKKNQKTVFTTWMLCCQELN